MQSERQGEVPQRALANAADRRQRRHHPLEVVLASEPRRGLTNGGERRRVRPALQLGRGRSAQERRELGGVPGLDGALGPPADGIDGADDHPTVGVSEERNEERASFGFVHGPERARGGLPNDRVRARCQPREVGGALPLGTRDQAQHLRREARPLRLGRDLTPASLHTTRPTSAQVHEARDRAVEPRVVLVGARTEELGAARQQGLGRAVHRGGLGKGERRRLQHTEQRPLDAG